MLVQQVADWAASGVSQPFLWIPSEPVGARRLGANPRPHSGRIPRGVRCRPAGILRLDTPRQPHGLPEPSHSRLPPTEVDSDVVGSAGGRTAHGRKRQAARVSQRQGHTAGGIVSPLLANLYLHWFDYVFHRSDGPAHWANAKLVRYADDFVVIARYQSDRLTGCIETTLEQRLAPTAHQPGENAHRGPERPQGEPGFSGLYLPVIATSKAATGGTSTWRRRANPLSASKNESTR